MASWVLIGSKLNSSSYATKNDSSYLVFSFDSVQSINNQWDLSLSKYPIESGTEVSDHLQVHNEQYTLTGMVSNFPIEKLDSNQIGYSNLGSPVENKNLNTRTKTAVDLLRQIKDNRQTITLVSEYSILSDVAITNVSFDQTPENSDSILFTLKMEKVRRASVGTTTVSTKTAKITSSNVSGGMNSKVTAAATAVAKYKANVAANE